MSFYFDFKRFFIYQKFLAIRHLKSISFYFVSFSLAVYGLTILSNTLFEENFFVMALFNNNFFSFIFQGTNIVYLIITAYLTSSLFSNLHDPIKSMAEYTLPVSTEEKFFGNFFFIYLVTSIHIIVIDALVILTCSAVMEGFYAANRTNFIAFFKNYFSYYNYIILIFFISSILFRNKRVIKILLLLVAVAIFHTSFTFLIEKFFQVNLNQAWLGSYSANDILFGFWIVLLWIYSYLRLKTTQFI